MDRVDAVVIGAGVVGLAVARALAMSGRETLVLEREPAIGTGISSRNSEVIHAGLSHDAGSLKARLCVQGRHALYRYCEARHVPHRRCGKLVVATGVAQHAALEALQARAVANGVHDLQWLSVEQARAMEPQLACTAALWSPSSGIVDSHALMLALWADLQGAGGEVALASEVVSMRVSSVLAVDGSAGPVGAAQQTHVLQVATAPGAGRATSPSTTELAAGLVVNAAGLSAPALAQRAAGLDRAHAPQARFSKGSYFSLAGASPFERLVYPLPQDAWLGVHLTLDLAGAARFGPDAEWLSIDDEAGIDYRVDPARAGAFYDAVRRYWPGLPDGALQPAYSGVRPKLHGPGEPAPDFRIDGPAVHGVPGLVNLFGIESPGLTSALAIADEVLARLG